MYLPLFLYLYESFWKGFKSDQRRLTLLRVRLLVWLVVNKSLKFRLTILILLTINYPLTALKLKPEIISQGDQELIVYMTILET